MQRVSASAGLVVTGKFIAIPKFIGPPPKFIVWAVKIIVWNFIVFE